MIKRILACLVVIILTVFGTTSVSFAATADSVAPVGGAKYSVVSVVVNREYDFRDDFHDSYPYDEDFYSEGIFRLDDYNGDVTITLRNNSSGEQFAYEKTSEAEWSVKASIDRLLYETEQIDASVHIYDLGGDYGIQEVDIPVKITVISSLYSADYHKYPSYEGAYTAMYEGEDFFVDYADGKATVTLLKKPWLFSLSLYNAETGQIEHFDPDDYEYVFPTTAEVDDYDPSSDSFWFFIPGQLILDDGYVYHFDMGINGFLNKKATDDSTATPDSVNPSSMKSDSIEQSPGTVQTGAPVGMIVFAAAALIVSAFVILYFRKRKNIQ